MDSSNSNLNIFTPRITSSDTLFKALKNALNHRSTDPEGVLSWRYLADIDEVWFLLSDPVEERHRQRTGRWLSTDNRILLAAYTFASKRRQHQIDLVTRTGKIERWHSGVAYGFACSSSIVSSRTVDEECNNISSMVEFATKALCKVNGQSYKENELLAKRHIFISAVRCDDLPLLEKFLAANKGFDLNATVADFDQQTALQIAIRNNSFETMKFLLTNGADVNRADAHGVTPLMQAAMWSHGLVWQLLERPQINSIAVDRYQRSALLWAVLNGEEKTFSLLLWRPEVIKTLPTLTDAFGHSPLQLARLASRGVEMTSGLEGILRIDKALRNRWQEGALELRCRANYRVDRGFGAKRIIDFPTVRLVVGYDRDWVFATYRSLKKKILATGKPLPNGDPLLVAIRRGLNLTRPLGVRFKPVADSSLASNDRYFQEGQSRVTVLYEGCGLPLVCAATSPTSDTLPPLHRSMELSNEKNLSPPPQPVPPVGVTALVQYVEKQLDSGSRPKSDFAGELLHLRSFLDMVVEDKTSVVWQRPRSIGAILGYALHCESYYTPEHLDIVTALLQYNRNGEYGTEAGGFVATLEHALQRLKRNSLDENRAPALHHALMFAIHADDLELLREILLLEPTFDLNFTMPEYQWRTLLQEALLCGYSEPAMLLLRSSRVDLTRVDPDGLGSLSYAAIGGTEELFRFLLQSQQGMINRTDKAGRTPFHWAVLYSRSAIIKLLLTTPGVELCIADQFKMTPLDIALRSNDRATVGLLMQDGRVRAHLQKSGDPEQELARCKASCGYVESDSPTMKPFTTSAEVVEEYDKSKYPLADPLRQKLLDNSRDVRLIMTVDHFDCNISYISKSGRCALLIHDLGAFSRENGAPVAGGSPIFRALMNDVEQSARLVTYEKWLAPATVNANGG